MSNTTDDSDVVSQIRLVTNNIYGYAGLIMFVIGTIGNACNFIVFTRIRSLIRLASSWFLLASFIGSQFVLSTGVLSRIIFGISHIDPLVSSTTWCKIRYVLGPLGGGTALTCISLASIDRYLVTSCEINRHRWITVRRARYMILIVIFIWLIALAPSALFYTAPSCTITNSSYALFSLLFSLTAYSMFPLIVLAIFSTLTWYNLHIIHSRIMRKSRIQRQVNGMILAQICVVLLTSVPNVILQVYSATTRSLVKTSVRQAQEGLLSAVLSMLGFTTYAGTFYVYLIASRSYRKHVKAVILQCQNRLNQVSSEMIQQRQ